MNAAAVMPTEIQRAVAYPASVACAANGATSTTPRLAPMDLRSVSQVRSADVAAPHRSLRRRVPSGHRGSVDQALGLLLAYQREQIPRRQMLLRICPSFRNGRALGTQQSTW